VLKAIATSGFVESNPQRRPWILPCSPRFPRYENRSNICPPIKNHPQFKKKSRRIFGNPMLNNAPPPHAHTYAPKKTFKLR
jgi:hypothetical protein